MDSNDQFKGEKDFKFAETDFKRRRYKDAAPRFVRAINLGLPDREHTKALEYLGQIYVFTRDQVLAQATCDELEKRDKVKGQELRKKINRRFGKSEDS